MNKRIIIVLSLLTILLLGDGLYALTYDWGIARLPSVDDLFITTAREESFIAKGELSIPYQPLGFVGIRTAKFSPCRPGMDALYESLESAMNKDLVEKAVDQLGAEAVIDLKNEVKSTFLMAYEKAAEDGEITQTEAYALILAYLSNTNIVELRGLAVKKK